MPARSGRLAAAPRSVRLAGRVRCRASGRGCPGTSAGPRPVARCAPRTRPPAGWPAATSTGCSAANQASAAFRSGSCSGVTPGPGAGRSIGLRAGFSRRLPAGRCARVVQEPLPGGGPLLAVGRTGRAAPSRTRGAGRGSCTGRAGSVSRWARVSSASSGRTRRGGQAGEAGRRRARDVRAGARPEQPEQPGRRRVAQACGTTRRSTARTSVGRVAGVETRRARLCSSVARRPARSASRCGRVAAARRRRRPAPAAAARSGAMMSATAAGSAVDPVGAEPAGQQLRAPRLAEQVERHRVRALGGDQAGELVAAGHQDQAAGRAGQQRPDLVGVAGVVERRSAPAGRPARCGRAPAWASGSAGIRSAGTPSASRKPRTASAGSTGDRGGVEAAQVHVELAVREPVARPGAPSARPARSCRRRRCRTAPRRSPPAAGRSSVTGEMRVQPRRVRPPAGEGRRAVCGSCGRASHPAPAGRPGSGRGPGSWRRIAASSSRSSGLGSMPSSPRACGAAAGRPPARRPAGRTGTARASAAGGGAPGTDARAASSSSSGTSATCSPSASRASSRRSTASSRSSSSRSPARQPVHLGHVDQGRPRHRRRADRSRPARPAWSALLRRSLRRSAGSAPCDIGRRPARRAGTLAAGRRSCPPSPTPDAAGTTCAPGACWPWWPAVVPPHQVDEPTDADRLTRGAAPAPPVPPFGAAPGTRAERLERTTSIGPNSRTSNTSGAPLTGTCPPAAPGRPARVVLCRTSSPCPRPDTDPHRPAQPQDRSIGRRRSIRRVAHWGGGRLSEPLPCAQRNASRPCRYTRRNHRGETYFRRKPRS